MNLSIYPFYLPETECYEGRWLNLTHVQTFGYNEEEEAYYIALLTKVWIPCPKEWVDLLEDEYKLIQSKLKHSPDEVN